MPASTHTGSTWPGSPGTGTTRSARPSVSAPSVTVADHDTPVTALSPGCSTSGAGPGSMTM